MKPALVTFNTINIINMFSSKLKDNTPLLCNVSGGNGPVSQGTGDPPRGTGGAYTFLGIVYSNFQAVEYNRKLQCNRVCFTSLFRCPFVLGLTARAEVLKSQPSEASSTQSVHTRTKSRSFPNLSAKTFCSTTVFLFMKE